LTGGRRSVALLQRAPPGLARSTGFCRRVGEICSLTIDLPSSRIFDRIGAIAFTMLDVEFGDFTRAKRTYSQDLLVETQEAPMVNPDMGR
jgi:hypothetical protein